MALLIDPGGLEAPVAPGAPSLGPVLAPPPGGFAFGLSLSGPGVTREAAAGQGVSLTTGGTLPITAPATAFIALTADPASPADGQIWIRSDLNEIRFRDQGITYKIAGTAA